VLYKAISFLHHARMKHLNLTGAIALFITCMLPGALQAAQDSPDCKPVARVYDTLICEKHITLDGANKEAILKQAEQNKDLKPQEAIHDFETARLVAIIWEKALHEKFGANAIRPEEKDIKAYMDAFYKRKALQAEYAKDTVKLAEKLLDENNYDAEAAMTINQIIAQHEKVIKQSKEDLKPDADDINVIVEVIEKWKGDKALYDAYGGGVIAGEDGLKPVEAYKEFMDDLRASKKVSLESEEFDNAFVRMDQFLQNAKKNYLPEKAQAQVQAYFAEPFWLNAEQIARQEHEYVKQVLMSLPQQKEDEN